MVAGCPHDDAEGAGGLTVVGWKGCLGQPEIRKKGNLRIVASAGHSWATPHNPGKLSCHSELLVATVQPSGVWWWHGPKRGRCVDAASSNCEHSSSCFLLTILDLPSMQRKYQTDITELCRIASCMSRMTGRSTLLPCKVAPDKRKHQAASSKDQQPSRVLRMHADRSAVCIIESRADDRSTIEALFRGQRQPIA
jgi:hypothetical protein